MNTEHCIEITPSGRKYRASYRGEHIGEFKLPECEGARWLKANRGAVDRDTLVTLRNGKPAMRGSIGRLAGLTVTENERASPRWAKYRPFELKPQDRPETACGAAQDGQVAVAATIVS